MLAPTRELAVQIYEEARKVSMPFRLLAFFLIDSDEVFYDRVKFLGLKINKFFFAYSFHTDLEFVLAWFMVVLILVSKFET